MTDVVWDAIIVGQGLAGTALALQLMDMGQRVLVIDAQESVTSSGIAAGLITPITGKRLALSAHYDDFLDAARSLYQHVEARTGRKIFHERTAIRLFKSGAERSHWLKRARDPAFQPYVLEPPPEPLIDPALCEASHGGFAMKAAQLDVAGFLDAARDTLSVEPGALDWRSDVAIHDTDISVRGHRTRRLISCEGFAASLNPYFSWIPFNAAKGDILTVRFEGPMPVQTLHRGIWVAPAADAENFLAGSTYDRATLDHQPSLAGRREIESQLRAFCHVPYTVLDHQAAIRPIVFNQTALVGRHPRYDKLGFFNSLGSKGALKAPWYARRFAAFLVHGAPLPDEADFRKRF